MATMTADQHAALVERIEALRCERGMSLDTLGVGSRTDVARIYAGRLPSLGQVTRIARVLSVTEAQLLQATVEQ